MGITEKELRDRIAEMRAAMDSAQAMAWQSAFVKIVGFLIILFIIGVFGRAVMDRVETVRNPDLWRPLIENRATFFMENNRFADKLPEAVQEVGPVYVEEVQRMAEELQLGDTLTKEFNDLFEQMEPIIRREFERAWPAFNDMILAEVEQAQADIEKLLDEKLNERLARILAEQELTIEQKAGLTKRQIREFRANLEQCAQEAASALIMSRVEKRMALIDRINELLTEVPPLERPMTQDEMIEQLGLALLARVKYELPDPDEVFRSRDTE